jgi:predicted LppA-like lipoprotein
VSQERITELENQLRAKPPFAAAQDEYRSAMRGMADQIAALVPGTSWNFVQDIFTDCGGDYVWTDAKEAYFLIGFSGPIPDEQWDRAVQIVKDGTRRFGATNIAVAKDNSGDHDIALSGSDGVDFKLSSEKAAALTGRSDCRI